MSEPQESHFELPEDIERYLAMLSKLYGKEGQDHLQKIIVNAKVRVVNEWSYDNWNGGMYGHALFLAMPEILFLASVQSKNALQNRIKGDLNKLHNVQNEFVAEVFLEMEVPSDHDWRKDSGVLLTGRQMVVSPETETRAWGSEGYRVFLSHRTDVKTETSGLKEKLKSFGVSCFVAHEDIHPTKEWQDEIESALSSMDALVALMTEEFHESLWTDQEVGFAFGRGVPIISVKLGRDPYGFIGKFQALRCSWDTAAREIAKILVKQNCMADAYIKAVTNCENFSQANAQAEILPSLVKLSGEQAANLVTAYNTNDQVRHSYGFNGKRSSTFGDGLPSHLSRMTGQAYRFSETGMIEAEA